MLDQRIISILELLSREQGVKLNQLQEKLQLSKRQAQYAIIKTNDWLCSHQLMPIESIRGKGLFLPESSQSWRRLLSDVDSKYIVLSEEERLPVVMLYILMDEEYMPLDWLASQLVLSRNTVLNTIKQIKANRQIKVMNSRQRGYYIKANEFEKRKMIYHLTNELLDMNCGKDWIGKIANCSVEVEECREIIIEMERKVGKEIADLPLSKLPYFLAISIKRIKSGRLLELELEEDPDIVNNQVFNVIEELLSSYHLPKREIAFITLIILSASVTSRSDWMPEVVKQKVEMANLELIARFEQLACIVFNDKSLLIELMNKHLQPAFYRMKYGLTYENPLLEVVKTQYHDLHYLVQKAIRLNSILGKLNISEHEGSYMTLIIGSQLRREGNDLNKRKHAIVVCTNGIAVSALLIQTLQNLLPDILFVEHMALRDFVHTDLEYDMVFSTVPVETDKSLYIVPSVLSNIDKHKLKVKVTQQEYGVGIESWTVENIITLVKSCSNDFNEEIFRERLTDLTLNVNHTERMLLDRQQPSLELQSVSKISSWQEGIEKSAIPLINKGIIDKSYLRRVMKSFKDQEDHPYMWLAPNVLIPHACPGCDVNEAAFSILLLDEPYYLKNMKVNGLVFLSAVDQTKHLEMLSALNLIFESASYDCGKLPHTRSSFSELIQNTIINRRKQICL